jgi:hypothetical protein
MWVGNQLHAPVALLQGKGPGTPIGGWVGARALTGAENQRPRQPVGIATPTELSRPQTAERNTECVFGSLQ